MEEALVNSNFKILVTSYLDYCEAMGQSLRTLEHKRSQLRFFRRWVEAEEISSIGEVTQLQLEAYRLHVARYIIPGRGRRLDIASQRNRLTVMKVFFKFLSERELIPSDPAVHFKLPKVPRRLPRNVFDIRNVERVMRQPRIGCPRGLRDRAIMEVFYASGIRRMELANLDRSDVSHEASSILVRRGKGNKDRRVPIAQRTVMWLKRYLTEARPRLNPAAGQPALFINNAGKRYRGGQLSDLVKKYFKRCGFGDRGACHTFRHTAATLMHQGGADLRLVQEFLGHADVSTTQVYTHVSIGRLREVYARTHPAARG